MREFVLNRTVPIREQYDIIIAGGGPSGVSAAVAAARLGANVALVERYGMLGGMLSSGNVGPIMGSVARGTLRDEITGRLRVGFNDIQGKVGRVHDIQAVPNILSNLLVDEHVSVYLQSPVVDVILDNHTVQGVIIGGRNGLYGLSAKVVVDATGDGDVACLAGARYEFGREEDGLTQPVTLMYTLAGVEEPAITCIGEEDNIQLNGERFLDFTARCVEQKILPPNTQSVRLYKTNVPGERLVNTTQVNEINPLEPHDVFRAEVALREQIVSVTEFLKNYVPGFQHCFIKSTATTLGVRESRRVMGEYVLTVDDLRAGREFDDVVVHNANFVVDIHNPTGGGQAEGLAEVVQPYDIPYRCLLPETVDGLLLTGRCISGTHHAHASYRITSVCLAVGEASGVAAALSCKEEVQPRRLPVAKVQVQLEKNGAILRG
jgi:hypothetical protein